jgi:hypothetical protein
MLQRRNECHKHTSSKCKEHTNSHRKETCVEKLYSKKIPPQVKVSSRRGKVLQGLHIRHASKVHLRETWSRYYAKDTEMKMRLARHDETPFNVFFTSPEKVGSVVFSCLESLKKRKRRLDWGNFFKGILVVSKKG